MILRHIDQNYDAAYYAGEPIVLEYQELDTAGAPVTLAGRVFTVSIFRAEDPTVGFAATGVTSTDGKYVTLTLDGSATLAFDTVRDGRYQLAETITLDDYTKWPEVIVAGRLSVEASSAVTVPGVGSLTPVGLAERVTRQGGRIRVESAPARPRGDGVTGLSPYWTISDNGGALYAANEQSPALPILPAFTLAALTARCVAAFTSDATFTLVDDGVPIALFTLRAGQFKAVGPDVEILAGYESRLAESSIYYVAPATPDPTGKGVSVTFYGAPA